MLRLLVHVLVIALCVLGAVACGDNLADDDEDDAATCNPNACLRAEPYCCDPRDAAVPDAGVAAVDASPPDAVMADAAPDADPYACYRDGCCEACCNPINLDTANCCQEPPDIPDPTIVLDKTTCTWWPAYSDAGVP